MIPINHQIGNLRRRYKRLNTSITSNLFLMFIDSISFEMNGITMKKVRKTIIFSPKLFLRMIFLLKRKKFTSRIVTRKRMS